MLMMILTKVVGIDGAVVDTDKADPVVDGGDDDGDGDEVKRHSYQVKLLWLLMMNFVCLVLSMLLFLREQNKLWVVKYY